MKKLSKVFASMLALSVVFSIQRASTLSASQRNNGLLLASGIGESVGALSLGNGGFRQSADSIQLQVGAYQIVGTVGPDIPIEERSGIIERPENDFFVIDAAIGSKMSSSNLLIIDAQNNRFILKKEEPVDREQQKYRVIQNPVVSKNGVILRNLNAFFAPFIENAGNDDRYTILKQLFDLDGGRAAETPSPGAKEKSTSISSVVLGQEAPHTPAIMGLVAVSGVPPAVVALRRSMIDYVMDHPGATEDEIMAAGDASGFRNGLRWMARNLARTNAELRTIVRREGKSKPGWTILTERSRQTLAALKKARALPWIDYKTYADLGVDYAMAVTFPDWKTAGANSRSIGYNADMSDKNSVAHLVDYERMFAKLKLRGGILDYPVVYDERGHVSIREMNDAAPAYDIGGLLGPHETLENGFYDAWGFLIHDLSHHGDRAAQLPVDAATRDADKALAARQAFAAELRKQFEAATGEKGPFEPNQRAAAGDLLEYLYFDAWHEVSADFVGAAFRNRAADISRAQVLARAAAYGVKSPALSEPGFAEKVAEVFRRSMTLAASADNESPTRRDFEK